MRANYITELGQPKIYAYTEPQFENQSWTGARTGVGLVKVGFTSRSVDARMKEHFPTNSPTAIKYKLLYVEDAITSSGEFFTDHAIHKKLQEMGARRFKNSEWFECTVDEVKNAILAQKTGKSLNPAVVNKFPMRPEQKAAVETTSKYFRNATKTGDKAPHFLWNAKMRFGKTFTAYQLALEMGWSRVMVLTYKPAVEREWRRELASHVDFDTWQFLGKGQNFDEIDETKPLVWFASFQDILGKTLSGGIKEKFDAAHLIDWDCIILDEYHFGAWRDAAKELYDSDQSGEKLGDLEFQEETFPLKTSSFLYLTGTPFRALANGEFLEDQIFTWSYIDEQKAKADWHGDTSNPYASLPQMVMMTYELPEEVRRIALKGELNEFDLNEFFRAKEKDNTNLPIASRYEFVHETEVQQWLSLVRGQYLQGAYGPEGGTNKAPLPYADKELLAYLNHSFWFLPSVSSCYAMAELLRKPFNNFFADYQIIVAAGTEAGIGINALPPVLDAIGQGFSSKSITLSCGKLTTGVSVPQWCSMFMLRNTSSPETYFQTAFRVQTPWAVRNVDNTDTSTEEILKSKCYIFDFAPNRALKLITEYSSRLDIRDEAKVEDKVAEFLKFLPVLSYSGFGMVPLDARELLNMAATGIGSTMLARRWQSPQLVRVDTDTLERLLANPDLVKALEGIEAFRNLGKDLTRVVSTDKAINRVEREKKELDPAQKKDKKENKNFKTELREKLLKFITRLPVFMYLTDFREESLEDVIKQLERSLFTKVTGLEISDFEKLSNIGVFNARAMNEAVYQFRRFEEASLTYAGAGRSLESIGLFNTKISAIEAL